MMAEKQAQILSSDTIIAEIEKCVTAMLAPERPAPERYDALAHQIEDYIAALRRIQRGGAGAAVDPVTGLRTAEGIQADLQREQDRFDRKGASFSVACIELDRLPELQGKYDLPAQNAVHVHLTGVISKTVRSFDDAYYLATGAYVLVLKHLKFTEACAAMERLRHNVEASPVALPNGEKIKITASFGVAEAVRMEKSDQVLEHAKEALQTARKEGGNRTREYHEVSKLARYVQEMQKEK